MKKIAIVTGSALGLFFLSAFLMRFVFTSRSSYDPETPLFDLRVILTSQVTYYDTYHTFSPDLASLGPPPNGIAPSAKAANLLSEKEASGSNLGYRFTYHAFSSKAKGPLDRFTINADPIDGCSTGCANYFIDEHGVFHEVDRRGCSKDCNHYFVDERGVIHVEAHSPATAQSPQISYEH